MTHPPLADGSLPSGGGGARARPVVEEAARLAGEAALRGWQARHWVPALEGGLSGWRGRLGWTQAAAAAALGVSLRAYSGWEQSRGALRRQTVLAAWVIEGLQRGDL